MTHYEELGVSVDASRQEIRQAYKRLVRLLHPDQCGEEAMRRLADLQMKRLNGILQVLMEPVARADYDLSLTAVPVAPARPLPLKWLSDPRWRRPSTAVAIAFLVLLLCAVLPLQRPPQTQPVRPAEPAPAVPEKKPARRSAARSHPRTPQGQEDLPAEEPAGEPAQSSLPQESRIAEPPPQSTPSGPTGESPLAATHGSIAGDWLFVASSAIEHTGYPPEYIELRVRDEDGTIRGRYRARYRVADRAISPNVAFQFEGRPPPEGGVLPWRGAGGSHGEITLRLLPNGDLDVEWAADRMGEELELISGKARLVRKVE